MNEFDALASRALEGGGVTREEAMKVLSASDCDTQKIVDAAYIVRKRFYGNSLRLHILCNAKSGLCPENCKFCSQSSVSKSPISRYALLSENQLYERAVRAAERKAYKFCIVISARGPSDEEIKTICNGVRRIKKDLPLKICTSLGILNREQAFALKAAGVDTFNHNLETSPGYFPKICTSHTFEDRVRTIQYVREAGIGTCCGGIIGMGETPQDVVDLAFAVKKLDIESIPVNFLNPVKGTPLEKVRALTPAYCLRVLAMFRFVNPDKNIRIAGGREINLKEFQKESLKICSSMFTEGYLTTPGNSYKRDIDMIQRCGFRVESAS